jgi:hypothetical protein
MAYTSGATSTRSITIRDGTVFTVGGSNYMGLLTAGSIDITTETVENKAIQDTFAYPVPTVRKWSVSATMVVDTQQDAKALMVTAASAVPIVTFAATLAAATYTNGTGVLTKCTETIGDGLTFDITIEGQGMLTVA